MGITIVIITHEMSVVETTCSHVAIIDNGTLAESGKVEDIFSHPESDAARRLIFRKSGAAAPVIGKRTIRIVFDGKSADEPVIANLIMECGVAVNIAGANTRDIGGKAFGEMILQLPEEKVQQEKVIYYLQTHGLSVNDVSDLSLRDPEEIWREGGNDQ